MACQLEVACGHMGVWASEGQAMVAAVVVVAALAAWAEGWAEGSGDPEVAAVKALGKVLAAVVTDMAAWVNVQ